MLLVYAVRCACMQRDSASLYNKKLERDAALLNLKKRCDALAQQLAEQEKVGCMCLLFGCRTLDSSKHRWCLLSCASCTQVQCLLLLPYFATHGLLWHAVCHHR
jgi:hypothetical protein